METRATLVAAQTLFGKRIGLSSWPEAVLIPFLSQCLSFDLRYGFVPEQSPAMVASEDPWLSVTSLPTLGSQRFKPWETLVFLPLSSFG